MYWQKGTAMKYEHVLKTLQHWNHENGNFIHPLRGWTDLLAQSREGLNQKALDNINELEKAMDEHGQVLSEFLEILEAPDRELSQEYAIFLIRKLSKKHVRDRRIELAFKDRDSRHQTRVISGKTFLKALEEVFICGEKQKLELSLR
jgi:hypothetical protein